MVWSRGHRREGRGVDRAEQVDRGNREDDPDNVGIGRQDREINTSSCKYLGMGITEQPPVIYCVPLRVLQQSGTEWTRFQGRYAV